MDPIDCTQNTINSSDIIARYKELEELLKIKETLLEEPDWGKLWKFAEENYLEEEYREFEMLMDVISECENVPEWGEGAFLINDVYVEDYAKKFAEDIGAIQDGNNWPNYCIDWDRAVDELLGDYKCVDINGETYWIRG